MDVRSIGLSTDLALLATRGTVADRGDCLVVETADDPGWSDGNFLVLAAAPRPLAPWIDRFRRELGTHRAVSLRWDDERDADADELRAAGLASDALEVLCADEVLAPGHSLEIRELSDVAATADLAWAIADRHDDAYRRFLKRRALWQQRLVEDGRARFFGAFDGDALVSSAGLVELGAIARYQDVQTHAAYRRRGLAGAVLATAARASRAKRFAIVAEPGGAAARVYRRIGFRAVERAPRAWQPIG